MKNNKLKQAGQNIKDVVNIEDKSENKEQTQIILLLFIIENWNILR